MTGFFNVIKGIFIGAGAIVPGVSSGVLCVIFGIYEKLLDAVLNFFKDIKSNFKFLFPIDTNKIYIYWINCRNESLNNKRSK